ncbi:MAG TPA: ABC transporter substrate-binding protein [Thermoanaerobaculia bacterium]
MRRLITFVIILTLAFACSPREKKAPPPANTAATAADDETPQDGGTIVRRLEADVTSLNPVVASSLYDRRLAFLIFSPLVHIDTDLRPIPGLADSWEISPDGRLYTFKLNPKATFSDGTPVKASDVLFTIRKIVDPASESVQIAGNFEHFDSANSKAVDDHTLVVAFRHAQASQLLRFNDVMAVPERIYSKGNFKQDFTNTPIGSGPYKLVRRVPGQELVLERRADYWAKPPYLQTIVFKVINDNNTAWNALKRGDIDETALQSETWFREQDNPQLKRRLEFRRFYTLNYNYVGWNTRDPLFADKRIRQALTMCLDRPALINDIYRGTARAMNGPFTPGEWAYNPAVRTIEYDPEGAKRAFASAGWLDTNGDGVLDKNGKPFEFDLILTSGSSTGAQFAQLYQAGMRSVGVKANIVTMEGTAAIQRILAGNFQAAYLGWDLDPDPDPYTLYHSSQFPPRGQNFVFYKNPEADRLLETARLELDFDERVKQYHRFHEVVADDQPYTWAIQVSLKWGFTNRVKGVKESRGGYGLVMWYPGELDWWIPQNQRRHEQPTAAAAPAAAERKPVVVPNEKKPAR